MTVDWLLSVLHFLLVFSVVAILTAQTVLLRGGLTSSDLRLAARLDRAYGLSAGLLIGAGFGRVFYGAKGASFYLANPVSGRRSVCSSSWQGFPWCQRYDSFSGRSRPMRIQIFCRPASRSSAFATGWLQKRRCLP